MKTMFAEKGTAFLILAIYMAVISVLACAADKLFK